MDRPSCLLAGVLALVTTTAAAAPPERSTPAVQVRPEGPELPPPASPPIEPTHVGPQPVAPEPEPAPLPDSPFPAVAGLEPAPASFEADPLEDPAWQRRTRRLTIATATLGGLTGAAFLGFVASRVSATILRGSEDNLEPPRPGYEAANTAMLATVILDGALAVALIGVAAARERHLERAAGARVNDLRRDLSWRARDRDLSGGLWTTGAIAGAGGVCYTTMQYFGAGDGPGFVVLPLCGVVGGAALVALAVVGGLRIRHRGRLDRWPKLAAGGLTWRF